MCSVCVLAYCPVCCWRVRQLCTVFADVILANVLGVLLMALSSVLGAE